MNQGLFNIFNGSGVHLLVTVLTNGFFFDDVSLRHINLDFLRIHIISLSSTPESNTMVFSSDKKQILV